MSGKRGRRTKSQSKSREQRQAEKQTLVIWALLANGGEGYGNQLKPEVKKPEREALLKSGLISVEKQKRAYWLSVTDRGWRWAEDHLSDQLPDRSYAGTVILAGWLDRLQAFMRASKTSLAEILVPKRTTPVPTDYSSLREHIGSAYLAVTGGSFSKRALLTDIRRHMRDVVVMRSIVLLYACNARATPH